MGKKLMPYHNDTTHERQADQEFGGICKTSRSYFDGFAICEQKVWVEKHAQPRACHEEGCYRTP